MEERKRQVALGLLFLTIMSYARAGSLFSLLLLNASLFFFFHLFDWIGQTITDGMNEGKNQLPIKSNRFQEQYQQTEQTNASKNNTIALTSCSDICLHTTKNNPFVLLPESPMHWTDKKSLSKCSAVKENKAE